MAGDISAYIPTNVISITDGQIVLETDLFFAGQRPAVNTGLSVSRVGGAAQTKAMKKASKGIKLEVAQYRDLASFAQFGSDLDKETLERLHQGERIMETLKQPQYAPLSMEEQVVIFYAVLNKHMMDIELADMAQFEKEFLNFVENNYPEILKSIRETQDLTNEVESKIVEAIEEFKKSI